MKTTASADLRLPDVRGRSQGRRVRRRGRLRRPAPRRRLRRRPRRGGGVRLRGACAAAEVGRAALSPPRTAAGAGSCAARARRLASRRRAREAFVGFVARRARGTSSARASRAASRSSASARLRAWLRASCATARTTGPQRAVDPRLLGVVERRRRRDVEARLDPRLGLVGVLAARPRRAAGLQHDLVERDRDVAVDRAAARPSSHDALGSAAPRKISPARERAADTAPMRLRAVLLAGVAMCAGIVLPAAGATSGPVEVARNGDVKLLAGDDERQGSLHQHRRHRRGVRRPRRERRHRQRPHARDALPGRRRAGRRGEHRGAPSPCAARRGADRRGRGLRGRTSGIGALRAGPPPEERAGRRLARPRAERHRRARRGARHR